MTSQPTEATNGGQPAEAPELFDAPADVPEGESIGYAVYDRELGQYVSEVYRGDKPKAADAKKLAEHYAIVAV